jgi:quercetin dioxygenase-like cupin family protein
MRKTFVIVVVLGLVGALGLFTVQGIPAEEATPAGEAPPLILESLGSAPSPDAPGMMLVLLRATLAPGAGLPAHVHPGQFIVAVESGTAAYSIVSEEGESGRGRFGTATASEVISPGTEVMLGPGEWIIEESGIVHTARNAGDEPLVLLISGLVTADEDLVQLVETDMATPAA